MTESSRRRYSAFAFWRWHWRTWCLFVPLMLAAYFFSFAPMLFIVVQTGNSSTYGTPARKLVGRTFQAFYGPVVWLISNSETANYMVNSEYEAIEDLFGIERPWYRRLK